MVGQTDMEAALSGDLAQSADALFAQAMAAGGIDNISILLLRVERCQPLGPFYEIAGEFLPRP